MAARVSNTETEKALRRCLVAQGYSISQERRNGETGVDVLAERGDERLFIEVIGHSSSPPKRSRDFFESFFRVISRLKDGAETCVIALPKLAKQGLPQRRCVSMSLRHSVVEFSEYLHLSFGVC